ncbi:MAG: amidohydrolase [Fusobacteria bacterium]|nr:MAG: amidohydrolase [Fusobacteriota bacterium]
MEKILSNMSSHRKELHKIPELGFKETKTQAYLIEKIKELGYKPQITCKTGVYVYINANSDTTYAFRSDIDALSITEETNCEYSSTHDGKMHACGHDGHMAILLGFLEYLKGQKLKKNILAIFQPAEEGPGGAKDIVESGILEKYNVKSIFGLHIFPGLEEGIIGSRAGGFMAKAAELDITINGKGGHGGQPHLGVDSIQVATKLLDGFNLINSKYINPLEPSIIAVGKISGGTIRNIIAKSTKLEGTIRTLSTENFKLIVKKIKDIARGLEIAYDVEITVEIAEGYPPVVNSKTYIKILEESIKNAPELEYQEIDPHMLAEDFGFYQESVEGVFFFLGSKNKELGYTYSLHNSKFNFSDKVLENGVTAYKALSKGLEIL